MIGLAGTTRAGLRPPDATRLPDGFTVVLAHDTHSCDGGRTLLGGSSGTVLRLAPRALALVQDRSVLVRDRDTALLARRLLDAGLADPVWAPTPDEGLGADAALGDVTVVVPVHDRPRQLARLLRALPAGVPVVVVDDGSTDAARTAAVVAAYDDAVLVRHERNRGPAAARNTGLARARTPLVAFVDSDVVPAAAWLSRLHRHFADPAVAVVAPRIRGLARADERAGGWIERYEAARSSLDLGPHPAAVHPHGRVAYLPSAALLVRACGFDGFEESMRVAEDVDAVWRTVESGWRVRYEPDAVVRHDHRTSTDDWLRRKVFYGTGAAPLAERHGSAVAPLVLSPWTAVLAAAALAQRRWSPPVLVAVTTVATLRTAQRLAGGRPDEAALRTAATATAIGVVATAHQTATALTRHHWPVAVPLALVSRRARRALLVAALAEGVLDHHRAAPALGLPQYVLAHRLDDLAYGAGLWAGAARARSARALLPRWTGLPGRRTSSAPPPKGPSR